MTKLDDALQGVQRLGVDTAPVIYFIEANPKYDALVTEIFQRISNGVFEGLCSVITLTEVLVQPLHHGDQQAARDYTDLLLHSQHFATVSIDPAIAKTAGELRARYNLRTPDALQIAAAMENGCQAFLTNDTTLNRVTEIESC
ncbi:MAG: PIN domain-containing protein [Planctomycetota bacterium]|nr:PIN domain-containing protein [Planctomycetota bacterium]